MARGLVGSLRDHLPDVRYKIFRLLSDGYDHKRDELRACLYDPPGEPVTLQVHLTALRKVINPIGLDVVCVRPRPEGIYRMVRLLARADDR